MLTAQVESARPPANLEKQVFALKPPQLSVLQRYLSIQDSALHSAISRRWMLLSMGMKNTKTSSLWRMNANACMSLQDGGKLETSVSPNQSCGERPSMQGRVCRAEASCSAFTSDLT